MSSHDHITVSKVFPRSQPTSHRSQSHPTQSHPSQCTNCGHDDHAAYSSQCPARRATCRACGKRGHYAALCQSCQTEPVSSSGGASARSSPAKRGKRRQQVPRQRGSVREVSEATVLACQPPQVKPRKVTCPVTMSIGDKRRDVEMQVDSGASCSVLCLSVARNLFKGCRFEPTKTSLFGFGKVPLKVVGSLPVHVEYGDAAADASLYLVDTTASECIMGLDLMQALGLTIQGHGGLTLARTVCSVHTQGR